MKAEILLAALALLAAFAGIWLLRPSRAGMDAQSGRTLLGWVFCFVGVMLLLISVAGIVWS